MNFSRFFFTVLTFGAFAVSADDKKQTVVKDDLDRPITLENVRTTAYTHSESDHIKYGRKTAIGTTLKYTKDYTSAAADWSHLPVGTKFKIEGIDKVFVIDDYGSALVGRQTVDLYYPTRRGMNNWGLRHVDLEILEFGDYEESRKILEGRKGWRHCRKMLAAIDDMPQFPPPGAPLKLERAPLLAEPEPEVMLANVEPETATPTTEITEPGPPEQPGEDDQPLEIEAPPEPVLVASAGPVRRFFRPLSPTELVQYEAEVAAQDAPPTMVISPAAMETTVFQKRSFVPITPQS